MSVLIRALREEDAPQILEIARELQEFELELHDRMLPVEAIGPWYLGALQARAAEEAGEILVAEAAGEILGYAALFTAVPQSGEIDERDYLYAEVSHVCVRASARGRGIGSDLLARCEARARGAGREWLRINALAGNSGARALYRQLGFAEHLVVMEKKLG